MSQKDVLQKKIDRLERYARFYLSMLLTILGGIVVGIIFYTLNLSTTKNKPHQEK